jgi:hypothetical protein
MCLHLIVLMQGILAPFLSMCDFISDSSSFLVPLNVLFISNVWKSYVTSALRSSHIFNFQIRVFRGMKFKQTKVYLDAEPLTLGALPFCEGQVWIWAAAEDVRSMRSEASLRVLVVWGLHRLQH